MAKNVKVYSTAACPFCKLAKDFLKEKNIEFQNFDVGQDKDKLAEMKEKSGQMGVPVFDIEGKIMVGFDKEAVSKELDL